MSERRLASPPLPASVVEVLDAAWRYFVGGPKQPPTNLFGALTRWDNAGRPGLPKAGRMSEPEATPQAGKTRCDCSGGHPVTGEHEPWCARNAPPAPSPDKQTEKCGRCRHSAHGSGECWASCEACSGHACKICEHPKWVKLCTCVCHAPPATSSAGRCEHGLLPGCPNCLAAKDAEIDRLDRLHNEACDEVVKLVDRELNEKARADKAEAEIERLEKALKEIRSIAEYAGGLKRAKDIARRALEETR